MSPRSGIGLRPYTAMPGPDHVVGQIGTGHRRRRVAQVGHFELHTLIAGLRQHVGQPLRLQVVDRVVRVVAVHQMAHHPAQPDRALGLGPPHAASMAGYSAAPTPLRFSPVSSLMVTVAVAAGALGRVEQFVELTHRRHRHLDVGLQRGGEVGARRVQPCQHRRGDAVAAQRQRLVDGRDTEFGGSGGQRGAGDRAWRRGRSRRP